MRTTLVVSVFVLAAALELLGASVAGVTLPDSADVAGRKLVLNGIGLRSKFMVKVYVGGLYLETKMRDANTIVEAEGPKRMVLHFVRSVSKDQMVDAYQEAFEDNVPNERNTLSGDIARLMAAFEPVNEGDEMFFTYVPSAGTTLSIKGQDRVTIPGQAFGRAMFACWLGPKPPSADLKRGLLGM